MNNPLITIVIASFNAEDFIIETLDSCINQTYKNIEIIIVDDCSSDNSVHLIKQWCSEKKSTHSEISLKLLTSDKNGGIPNNLNKALPEISGEWIKCIGSDDILLPDALENFVERLSQLKNTQNVGAIFTYFETFGLQVNNPQQFPLAWTRDVIKLDSSWLKLKLAMLHFNNVAPGAFINSNKFDGFDTDYRLLEDLPLWLKLINDRVDVLFFDYTSVLYRIHGSQITSSFNTAVGRILYNDLKKMNLFRLENHGYLSYMHHKFNLFSAVNGRKNIILKGLNPINLLIYLYERVKK
ncbi:glycosyltransferase [Cedecea neteri]|uniref:glycosyltransferase n=1 Tax=Cedecea neteri TaxID=158822 RepID=UPI002AA820E8|nr:glycosyltransferase [Cedecea neteri]WPU24677.1 glycosyltransferase [Cedecea neteri]